jgi:hypothetical protein
VAIALALTGCDNFFGNKTDDGFIAPPVPDNRTVTYVAVQPSFSGFRQPVDFLAGNDQLFYVVDINEADPSKNEVICLNEAGARLSSIQINGATAIAQDRKLDLIVLGRLDYPKNSAETINVPAIYRLNLKKGAQYGLANAVITDTIIQPFYFARNRTIDFTKDNPVHFNDVAILPDNRFLVTRSGPGTDLSTRIPDDAVLLFNTGDSLVTTINVSGEGGALYNNYFHKPFGIATVPPQQLVLSNSENQDFIVTTQDADADTVLRVKYIQTNITPDGISYQVKVLPLPSDTTIHGSLYQSGMFRNPKGVTFANDQTGYIFIADSDSLCQFSPEGFQGVKLSASALRKGYNNVSFGGTGSGPYRFNQPFAVAYSNRIVYVADSKNGEIKRFKLSTDFQ